MLKKIGILSLIIIFAGYYTPVMAVENQKVLNLSLENCIELAIKNNLDLKIERITPEMKKLDLRRIYDEFGFSLSFNPAIQNNIRPTSNSFISGASVLNEFSQSYDFSAKKKLLTNGQISLDFQNGIVNTNSTRVDFNPSITPRFSVNFQQPLLKDALNGFRRISIGNNDTLASKLRLKSKAIDLISQTEQSYWELVLNKEKLKVLENSLNLTKELLKINKEKERVGSLAKIEVLTTEANLAAQEENLLQQKRILSQSEDFLKKLINPSNSPEEWDILIKTSDIPEINKINVNFNDVYDKALKNRADFQAILIDEKNLGIQTEIAMQNRLPSLNFNGSFGLTSLDKEYFNALQNLFSFKTYTWNIGLNLEIPVTGNSGETIYQQALLNQGKQRLTIDSFIQTLINDVRSSVRDIEINRKRMEANALSKNLMNEQVKAKMEKFALGLSTNYDVLQSQRDFAQTSLNEVNSRIDYIKSLIYLGKIEGLTLEKHKIIWDDGSEKKAE